MKDSKNITQRPPDSEYAPSFAGYVSLVPETGILGVLEKQADKLVRLVATVAADRETFRYATGKWSIREVIGHIVDAERVFGYRAFCISRGEQANLPAFDENEYVSESDFHDQPLQELAAEFAAVREANLAFLCRLDDKSLQRIGTSNGKEISVRALLFIMAGHVQHHFNVLDKKYGISIGK